jgi:hypothetical protein
MNRVQLHSHERSLRSILAQLVSSRWLLRGSLSLRSRKCGKPTCHCAKGEKHTSLYLIQSQQGQLRQIYVPPDWEARVRLAVVDYQKAQKLLEEISQLEWQRLRERKEY